MRFFDYMRLGFANVSAHKKRSLLVIIVVGLLFSVITAGVFVIQGSENAVLGEMLSPTKGKVLTMTMVDTVVCKDKCRAQAGVLEVGKNVEKYGGELIETRTKQTEYGVFHGIDSEIFVESVEKMEGDALQVMLPLDAIARLAGIEMPEQDASIEEKVESINTIQQRVLFKIIEEPNGLFEDEKREKYYIAGILPSGVFSNNLSFNNLHQAGNPLDLIFNQVQTGISQNFIIEEDRRIEDESEGQSDNFMTEIFFAEFPNIESAFNYSQYEQNYCPEKDRAFQECNESYKYRVFSAISDPLKTYGNFQNIWLVFKIAMMVFAVVALIIMLSTYVRLINDDIKVISFYYTLGATKYQVRLVYMIYLAILSLMVAAFAVFVGAILAIALSVTNTASLEKLFMLGFGMTSENIWLIGWNNLIWFLIAIAMSAAIMATIISNGVFRTKMLARKIK